MFAQRILAKISSQLKGLKKVQIFTEWWGQILCCILVSSLESSPDPCQEEVCPSCFPAPDKSSAVWRPEEGKRRQGRANSSPAPPCSCTAPGSSMYVTFAASRLHEISILTSSFAQWGNWSSEMLINLSEIVELLGARVGLKSKTAGLPGHCFLPHPNVLLDTSPLCGDVDMIYFIRIRAHESWFVAHLFSLINTGIKQINTSAVSFVYPFCRNLSLTKGSRHPGVRKRGLLRPQ